MRIERGTYEHTGKNVSFLAKPAPTLGLLSLVGLAACQIVAEVYFRRYLRWLFPLVRRGRMVTFSAMTASVWASLGITILRIGRNLYVEGMWIDLDGVVEIVPPGAPNPMRDNHHLIVCSDGRTIKTRVDATTFHRHGCGGR